MIRRGSTVRVPSDGSAKVPQNGTFLFETLHVDAFDSVRRCDKRIVAPPSTQER
jgi:hypothetical protein